MGSARLRELKLNGIWELGSCVRSWTERVLMDASSEKVDSDDHSVKLREFLVARSRNKATSSVDTPP
jgi:hypothetical protein